MWIRWIRIRNTDGRSAGPSRQIDVSSIVMNDIDNKLTLFTHEVRNMSPTGAECCFEN
jgi:hypothetical protein